MNLLLPTNFPQWAEIEDQLRSGGFLHLSRAPTLLRSIRILGKVSDDSQNSQKWPRTRSSEYIVLVLDSALVFGQRSGIFSNQTSGTYQIAKSDLRFNTGGRSVNSKLAASLN